MFKTFEIAILLDRYGKLLTQKQQEIMDLYYNQDNSLGEIAEKKSITRQSVLDSVNRSIEVLNNYENILGFNAKLADINAKLNEVLLQADGDVAEKIRGIIDFTEEL